jgi:hypothetical protein
MYRTEIDQTYPYQNHCMNPQYQITDLTLPFVVVWLMVFNTTFNNISAISWRSVLLVEEIGGPGENHRPVASH